MARATCAFAVVNIDTTRIVFNEKEVAKVFQLKNSGSSPALVQLWTDYGDPLSSPDLVKTPVVALPPVNKMFANETRSFRLILSSRQSLKRNEESLYWLNIYQIPVMPDSAEQPEQMLVLPLRIRIKVFVRPKGISAPTHDDYKKINFRIQDGRLVIENPLPWFITMNVRTNYKEIKNNIMLPPLSDTPLAEAKNVRNGDVINYQVIDDLGNTLDYEKRTEN